MSETMRAIQVHRYGGPEVLQLEEVARPSPGAGELLIRVHATGVLPMDTYVRSGAMAQVAPRPLPYIPGTAFAGAIAAVGSGVTGFEPGQAVCGRTTGGATAEYTTTLAVAPPITPDTPHHLLSRLLSLVAPLPTALSFDEGAALSGGATTAWTSTIEDGGLQPGQRVLIHGAAGGVGLFAVQFARWKGAHVVATTSAANLEYVRSLGAETVIDYTATPFEEAGQVDLVLDTIGGATMQRSMRLLRRGGTLVSVVESPPAELAQELGIRAVFNPTIPNSGHLRRIVELINAGEARPAIRQSFPMVEASRAHALSETGHGRGRVVIRIGD
jgi:NADPH:quinone reductase-like Zn-dependent oxidoreductase